MNSTEKINESSFNPLRTYLTLIVLFALATCVAAGVALGLGSSSFNSSQQWALIAFMFVFPFAALAIISWLVLRHAKKMSASDDNRRIDWQIVPSSKQKSNLNREVNQLAAVMKIPKEQLTDLRSAYIVAEDLALRKIQQETKIPLLRYVNVGDAEFNAVCIDEDLITCVQVTFVVSPDIRQEKINAILRKLSTAKVALNRIREGTRIRLLLVIVTQLDKEAEAKLRTSLVSKFSATPVDVDIRLLDFQGLQKVYSEN